MMSLMAGDDVTTAAGAERMVVGVMAAVRLGTVAQMAPSVQRAMRVGDQPLLTALTWAVAVGASGLLLGWALLRRRPPSTVTSLLDAGVVATLFVLGLATVPPGLRVGSFVGFQSAYALAVVIGLGAVRRRDAWLAGVLVVVVGKVVFLAPVWVSSTAATLSGEMLTLVLSAVISRAAVGYVRSLADQADRSRAEAAALARLDEGRQARRAIHNGAAVMGLLTEPDLDPEVREVVRHQGRAELARMRRYLAGARDASAGPAGAGADDPAAPQPLVDVVERVCRDFADLAPHTVTDLAVDVLVAPAHVAPLGTALSSVLLNVRIHAGATTTVVHADHRDDDTWVVTVHDDGAGFDPDSTSRGVGLGRLVVADLDVHDMEARVDSIVGLGTTVTVSGACWRPASRSAR